MLISMLLKCSYLVLIILILNLVMLQQRLSFWLCLGKTWWVFETHSAEDGQTVKMCMFWSGLICFESIVKLFKVVWRRFEHRLPSKHSTEFFPCKHSARCTGRQSIVAFTGNEGSHENQELEPRLLAGFLPSHCALEVSRGTILRSCAVYKEIDIEKCTIAELQTLIASKSHVAVGWHQNLASTLAMSQSWSKSTETHIALNKQTICFFSDRVGICRCKQHLLISCQFFTVACIPLRATTRINATTFCRN